MKDPVCGMDVDEKTSQYKTRYGNETYYFCSQTCKTQFDKNPMKFIKEGATTHESHVYHGGCGGCGMSSRGPALYLWIGLMILLLASWILSRWLR
jgi:YHS domain-containing protein